jgi:hypothetical protein
MIACGFFFGGFVGDGGASSSVVMVGLVARAIFFFGAILGRLLGVGFGGLGGEFVAVCELIEAAGAAVIEGLFASGAVGLRAVRARISLRSARESFLLTI